MRNVFSVTLYRVCQRLILDKLDDAIDIFSYGPDYTVVSRCPDHRFRNAYRREVNANH